MGVADTQDKDVKLILMEFTKEPYTDSLMTQVQILPLPFTVWHK